MDVLLNFCEPPGFGYRDVRRFRLVLTPRVANGEAGMAEFARPLRLKVVLPNGTSERWTMDGSSTLGDLVEKIGEKKPLRLVVAGKPLMGAPSESLVKLGVASGDAIRVFHATPGQASSVREGKMVRRVVPADNSCLFAAVGFLVAPEKTDAAPRLRRVVADAVRSDPDFWTTAMLGKAPDEYAANILKPEAWGGSIELTILSSFFETQFVAVDIINLTIHEHPAEATWPQRAFLLWDGIHYDPLIRDDDVTTFPPSDSRALEAAMDLAKEANASRQFVDVQKFALRCLVCGTGLEGQAAAMLHAQTTGHTNFGQT